MSCINWIPCHLERQFPGADLSQGVDLNENGVLEENEKIKDFNQNNRIGDSQDWFKFFEKNERQIRSLGGIWEYSRGLPIRDPLHKVLAQEYPEVGEKKIIWAYQYVREELPVKGVEHTQDAWLLDVLSRRAEFFFQLGNQKFRDQDGAGAKRAYNQAIQNDPKHSKAYVMRGNVRKGMGDLTGAESDFTKSIALNPKLEFAYHCRALLYLKKEDYQRAKIDLEQVLKINPNNRHAKNHLLFCNFKLKQKSARSNFQKVIQFIGGFLSCR